MTENFRNLSPEGKLAKIIQHLDTSHPVNSEWAKWLLFEFVPVSDASELTDDIVATAFDKLDGDDRLAKLQHALSERSVPGPWVAWVIEKYVNVPVIDEELSGMGL